MVTATPARAWRLFLALWPPEAMRAQLDAHAAAWHWPSDARRTRPDRLHATLHFLGDVPLEAVEPLVRDLAAVRGGPFRMVLDAAQVWPGGIAVLEASRVPPALGDLHGAMAAVLRAHGLRTEERRFRPHVTFARRAQGARPRVGMTPIAWDCDGEFVLVRSLPGGQGYQPLQRFG